MANQHFKITQLASSDVVNWIVDFESLLFITTLKMATLFGLDLFVIVIKCCTSLKYPVAAATSK